MNLGYARVRTRRTMNGFVALSDSRQGAVVVVWLLLLVLLFVIVDSRSVAFTRLLARIRGWRVGRRDAAPSTVCDRAPVVLRDDAHLAYAVAPPAHRAAMAGPATP